LDRRECEPIPPRCGCTEYLEKIDGKDGTFKYECTRCKDREVPKDDLSGCKKQQCKKNEIFGSRA